MKSFPTLLSRRIVPGFSSNSFSVLGFTLKSLMHLTFVDNRPSSKWMYGQCSQQQYLRQLVATPLCL